MKFQKILNACISKLVLWHLSTSFTTSSIINNWENYEQPAIYYPTSYKELLAPWIIVSVEIYETVEGIQNYILVLFRFDRILSKKNPKKQNKTKQNKIKTKTKQKRTKQKQLTKTKTKQKKWILIFTKRQSTVIYNSMVHGDTGPPGTLRCISISILTLTLVSLTCWRGVIP